MFVVGLILLILGFVFGIQFLWIIGAILLVLGLLGNGYAHFGPAPAAGARRRYWW